MNSKEIQNEIAGCFEGTTRPQEDQLIHPDVKGIYEAEEMKKAFSSITWKELNPDLMLKHKTALNYFADNAFIYYLPAYLQFILSDFQRSDVLVDILLEKLTLPSRDDILKSFLDYSRDPFKPVDLQEYYETEFRKMDDKIHGFMVWVSKLSFRESACVLAFLNYLRNQLPEFFQNDIVHLAIYRYWFIFDRNSGR